MPASLISDYGPVEDVQLANISLAPSRVPKAPVPDAVDERAVLATGCGNPRVSPPTIRHLPNETSHSS